MTGLRTEKDVIQTALDGLLIIFVLEDHQHLPQPANLLFAETRSKKATKNVTTETLKAKTVAAKDANLNAPGNVLLLERSA